MYAPRLPGSAPSVSSLSPHLGLQGNAPHYLLPRATDPVAGSCTFTFLSLPSGLQASRQERSYTKPNRQTAGTAGRHADRQADRQTGSLTNTDPQKLSNGILTTSCSDMKAWRAMCMAEDCSKCTTSCLPDTEACIRRRYQNTALSFCTWKALGQGITRWSAESPEGCFLYREEDGAHHQGAQVSHQAIHSLVVAALAQRHDHLRAFCLEKMYTRLQGTVFHAGHCARLRSLFEEGVDL